MLRACAGDGGDLGCAAMVARTLFVFLAVSAALALTLLAVREGVRWPEAEVPPRQGEAVLRGSTPPQHMPEALRRLVREPQNTWSNLAFVLGGAWLLVRGRLRMARAVGVALVVVGVGSFLYHASASRTLRHLDVGAMYWLFLLLAALALGNVAAVWRNWSEPRAALIAIGTALAAVGLTAGRNLVVLGMKPFSLTIATGLAATLTIASLVIAGWRRRTGRMGVAVAGVCALFAVALVCQLGDQPGRWLFNPGAVVQAHALWHVFSAAAVVGAVAVLDRASEVRKG